MKIHQEDSATELTESTLPMINVVFLLLIFFMIAGSLQKTLPYNLSPLKAQAEIAQQAAPLMIHVAADGRIMVAEQEITLEQIKDALKLQPPRTDPILKGAQAGSAASETSSRPITIRSDQSTNTSVVVKLLAQLKELNVKQVALATIP